MSKENPSNSSEITFSQRALRKTARIGLDPWFLRRSGELETTGMMRAEELHRDGYGILVLIPHFSRRDPVQAMDEMMKSKEFQHTKITGPIAYHQTIKGLVPPIGRKLGVKMHPVVTPESFKKIGDKNPDLRVGSGGIDYLKSATETLVDGGVVILAPQATRKPTLEYSGEQGVSALVKITAKKTRDIGIHLLAFGMENTEDYNTRRGFNFLKPYNIIHGPTFTYNEMLDLSKNEVSNFDRTVFEEFAKIVPPAYLPKT